MADGKLREDLYYRLNIFALHWSALRERPEDLILLAQRLLHKMNRAGVTLAASAHCGGRKDASVQMRIRPRTLRYNRAQMRDSGIDVDGLLKG